jgi:hypothetical protein
MTKKLTVTFLSLKLGIMNAPSQLIAQSHTHLHTRSRRIIQANHLHTRRAAPFEVTSCAVLAVYSSNKSVFVSERMFHTPDKERTPLYTSPLDTLVAPAFKGFKALESKITEFPCLRTRALSTICQLCHKDKGSLEHDLGDPLVNIQGP